MKSIIPSPLFRRTAADGQMDSPGQSVPLLDNGRRHQVSVVLG